MNHIFGSNLINSYLHLMVFFQEANRPEANLSFEHYWASFAFDNCTHLRNNHKDIHHTQMLLNPRYAASHIQKTTHLTPNFWVEVRKNLDMWSDKNISLFKEISKILIDASVPTSIFRAFSPVWKGIVAEIIIEDQGAKRIRSHAQHDVYCISRSDSHKFMASIFEQELLSNNNYYHAA